MTRCTLTVGLLFTVLFHSRADGNDWWQFRGPTGQGHAQAKNLPVEWSPTRNVVWKQELAGSGWSSPVLHDGHLYLTAAVPLDGNEQPDYSLRVYRVRAQDGQLLENVEVFVQTANTAPRIHRKNSHASPTPLIVDDRLYVHFGHQGTACLDLRGNVVWRTRKLAYEPVHGNGGSPVVVGDKLVFSCDGAQDPFVVALDRQTGQVVWKTLRVSDAVKKFSFSTPLVIDVAGQKQVISPGSNVVGAYDPQTGEEIWRVRYDGYSVVPRPVYGHGLVFVGTGFNSPSVLAIRPDGQGDVTDTHVQWSVKRGAPHTPSLLLVDDELYMVSDRGIASCLDAKTGKMHWQERIGGAFSASPLYADGKIYLQSEEGLTIVLKPGREFQQIAKNDLQQRTFASYAVGDNALFIRSDQHLYRIQQR